MSSKLDMTLDQLVKMDKSSSSGNKRNLRPKRNNPIQRPRANQAPRRDLQTRGARSAPSAGAESSAKINISNLNNNVTSNDLRDIFSKVGPIRSAHINFRENGTSAGTGSVIFKLSGDALTAFKRYHNVKLDGRPMRIEVAFIPSEQSEAPQASTQQNSRPPRRSGPPNRRGGPRGGGARRGGGRPAPKTADQLDKELQGYMNTGGDDTAMIVED